VDLRQAAIDQLKSKNDALLMRLKNLEDSGVRLGGAEDLVGRQSWDQVVREKQDLEGNVKQKVRGRSGSTATVCPKRQGCAPGREVVGPIPPAAVTVRLHSWLCHGKTTELPIWGERSEKGWLRGQGQ
jgi:hypothetical protein